MTPEQELAEVEKETTKHYLGECNCKNQGICYQEAQILLVKQEYLQKAIAYKDEILKVIDESNLKRWQKEELKQQLLQTKTGCGQ